MIPNRLQLLHSQITGERDITLRSTGNAHKDCNPEKNLYVMAAHLMFCKPIFYCGNPGPQVHCYYPIGNNES